MQYPTKPPTRADFLCSQKSLRYRKLGTRLEDMQKEPVVMHITPLELLDALRESDPYIATIYKEGGCYRLHLMLTRIWPDALPVINATGDHVGSLIGGEVYDITGVADWDYREMDDDDIAQAEQWSFARNSMLQIGECPVCEEPIVATTNLGRRRATGE